jgi:hypothetical protein
LSVNLGLTRAHGSYSLRPIILPALCPRFTPGFWALTWVTTRSSITDFEIKLP